MKPNYNILDQAEEVAEPKTKKDKKCGSFCDERSHENRFAYQNLINDSLVKILREPFFPFSMNQDIRVWQKIIQMNRDFKQIDVLAKDDDIKTEVAFLRLQINVLMKTLEENKKAIDDLSQYLGNNSNIYNEESEMAKLCASYIDLIKDLDMVQEVYKSEDPGCLSIWTIVNTTPFDSKALAPVYKAQVDFYANREDKLKVDIRVINRSEYPDVDVRNELLPKKVTRAWDNG
jgi:hypothetical protein